MKTWVLNSLIFVSLSIIMFGCSEDSDMLSVPDGITTAAELSDTLEEIVTETEAPGFAVTLVKNNQVLYQEAFGYADIEGEVAYTNQTIQHLGSISKTFVGAAVVKAVEDGLFTLDTDINDILPVEVVNPKQPDAVIQIKHLATHTSGLLDNTDFYIQENYYILPGEDLSTPGAEVLHSGLGIQQRRARSLEEFLAEYYLEDGDMYTLNNFAPTAPGEAWSYSNTATALAAYLIEAATGASFADYVKEKVLTPLGMNSSSYRLAEVNQAQLAKWYLDEDTPLPLYDNDSYPEGSMYTTNADMGKYLLDMSRGVMGESNVLFSSSGYDLLFDARLSPGIVPAGFAENHGIFWYHKGGTVQHGGNSLGISTHLEINKATGSGYVLITNMDASFSDTEAEYAKVAQLIDQAVSAFLASN